MYKHLITFTVLAGLALADLTCHDYIPKNATTNKGQLNFFGEPFSALPRNASVGNPWKLAGPTALGATFVFKTCSSKSLNVSSSETQSCEFNPCYTNQCCGKNYVDYIQIINPYTGHCATIQNFNASSSEIVFMPCGTNNLNTSQLWQAAQGVVYGYSFKTPPEGYGESYIYPVESYPQNAQGLSSQWALSPTDNKTILVNQTADGGFISMGIDGAYVGGVIDG